MENILYLTYHLKKDWFMMNTTIRYYIVTKIF